MVPTPRSQARALVMKRHTKLDRDWLRLSVNEFGPIQDLCHMVHVSAGTDTYGRVKTVSGTPIVTKFAVLQTKTDELLDRLRDADRIMD